MCGIRVIFDWRFYVIFKNSSCIVFLAFLTALRQCAILPIKKKNWSNRVQTPEWSAYSSAAYRPTSRQASFKPGQGRGKELYDTVDMKHNLVYGLALLKCEPLKYILCN